MENKKTISCKDLHHSVYLAPDELRHCCKRFFYKNKMKGDVKIFKVGKNTFFDSKKILDYKKKLIRDINENKDTPCTGCPYLVKDYWPSLEKLKIKTISIESHSVCNMKCTYCSEVYYAGKKSNYDLVRVLDEFDNSGSVSEKLHIAWGGGEPVLLDDFENIFKLVNKKFNPATTMVYTNSTKYSPSIEEYLISGKIKITTSIDAGTLETFKKVRGVKTFDKVFSNLRKYYSKSKKGIIIKYILNSENSSDFELNSFVEKIKEYGLEKCEFQISSDYKNELISKFQAFSALNLYFNLKKLGSIACFFDYHLRPRMQKEIKKFIINNDKDFSKFISNKKYNQVEFNKVKNVIIWGAGDTARSILNDSYFLKKYSIKVDFIVDTDAEMQNKKINDISVFNPSSILKSNSHIIIASTAYYKEIKDSLMSLGVKSSRLLDSIFF